PGVPAELRRRENQGRIACSERVPRLLTSPKRLSQKSRRVRALPLRIRRREQRPDVRSSHRPQQGVSNRVQQNIAVGVATQALRMFNGYSANLQRNAALDVIRVPTVADSP